MNPFSVGVKEDGFYHGDTEVTARALPATHLGGGGGRDETDQNWVLWGNSVSLNVMSKLTSPFTAFVFVRKDVSHEGAKSRRR